MDLTNKVAFVTGGSGDIGGAIARALAGAGADVAISYLGHTDGARATLDEIERIGRRGLHVQLDQRDGEAIAPAIANVAGHFGRLDILINNAAWNVGIAFPDLDTLSADVWDRMMETNLRAPYLLARAAAPYLRASGAGRIVNIASLGGLYPASSSIAYSTSKAGLIHLTRCLAVALAPAITVNCVAPGVVEGTRMVKRMPAAVAEIVKRDVVLGRTGSALDVANQVVTFCRADSVTGQVIVVDGGLPGGMR